MKKINVFKSNQVMKKYIYNTMLILLVMSVMLSCEKEYETPEANHFSDAVAVASGNKRIERGNITSFADLSKGVTAERGQYPHPQQ